MPRLVTRAMFSRTHSDGKSFLIVGQALPRSAFGEPDPNSDRTIRPMTHNGEPRRVEPFESARLVAARAGECKDRGQCCPVGLVPCPELVYISHTGWPLCSLCDQIKRTAQPVRRVHRNSLHHYYVMQELQNMENYVKRLAESKTDST